jgi:hypothetical protein
MVLTTLHGRMPVDHMLPSTGTLVPRALGTLGCLPPPLPPYIQVSKSTSFGVSDLFFTTSVTLENTGDNTLFEVQYMRNVDPDQEQVHTLQGYSVKWYYCFESHL